MWDVIAAVEAAAGPVTVHGAGPGRIGTRDTVLTIEFAAAAAAAQACTAAGLQQHAADGDELRYVLAFTDLTDSSTLRLLLLPPARHAALTTCTAALDVDAVLRARTQEHPHCPEFTDSFDQALGLDPSLASFTEVAGRGPQPARSALVDEVAYRGEQLHCYGPFGKPPVASALVDVAATLLLDAAGSVPASGFPAFERLASRLVADSGILERARILTTDRSVTLAGLPGEPTAARVAYPDR
jgi:hypothetical protein